MPSPDASHARREDAGAGYSYRRPLGLRELLPAIGIAVGAGLFAYYVTRLLLQRTPLEGRGEREARLARREQRRRDSERPALARSPR